MKRFAILTVIMIITGILLALLTELEGGISQTRLLGLPVVSLGSEHFAWLSVGVGAGLVVVGVAGAGVVTFSLYGAGLLFGTGQLSCGLISFGQLSFGLLLVIGQLGFGFIGAGQVVIGAFGWGQGRLAGDGQKLLKELNKSLDEALRFL